MEILYRFPRPTVKVTKLISSQKDAYGTETLDYLFSSDRMVLLQRVGGIRERIASFFIYQTLEYSYKKSLGSIVNSDSKVIFGANASISSVYRENVRKKIDFHDYS